MQPDATVRRVGGGGGGEGWASQADTAAVKYDNVSPLAINTDAIMHS